MAPRELTHLYNAALHLLPADLRNQIQFAENMENEEQKKKEKEEKLPGSDDETEEHETIQREHEAMAKPPDLEQPKKWADVEHVPVVKEKGYPMGYLVKEEDIIDVDSRDIFATGGGKMMFKAARPIGPSKEAKEAEKRYQERQLALEKEEKKRIFEELRSEDTQKYLAPRDTRQSDRKSNISGETGGQGSPQRAQQPQKTDQDPGINPFSNRGVEGVAGSQRRSPIRIRHPSEIQGPAPRIRFRDSRVSKPADEFQKEMEEAHKIGDDE